MATTITATHRLRRPLGVVFNPDRHFAEGIKTGARVKLPVGTHVIPTEAQLKNMPDRFERLAAPEAPQQKRAAKSSPALVKDKAEGKDDEKTEGDLVAETLASVGGEWDALTSTQVQGLAAYLGITEEDVQGTGSGGNILKADWIGAVRARYEEGAAE